MSKFEIKQGGIMNNFTFYNPVRVHFGKGQVTNLKEELKDYNKILVTYGGGSIKKNGVYDDVMKNLKGKEVFELSGITPNPRTDKVYEGIKICKENDIDFILAVGGGSTLDCSKAIAMGAKTNEDFWDYFFEEKNKPTDAIKLGTVITMAGTGSEMDGSCVISNIERKKKYGYGHRLLYPVFSIIDPTYTYSLPKYQLISGTCDMFSHIMEEYFSEPDYENTTDNISESLMKTVIDSIRVALKNPEDYQARSNLMWVSTLAINGLTATGKSSDWLSHKLEHTLSAYFDVTHGMGLAVVHPNYLKFVYKNHLEKFRSFAINVWNIDPEGKTDEELALESIEALQNFFKEIGAPTTLRELDIPKDKIKEMAENTAAYKTSYSDLSTSDIETIYNNAY